MFSDVANLRKIEAVSFFCIKNVFVWFINLGTCTNLCTLRQEFEVSCLSYHADVKAQDIITDFTLFNCAYT